MASSAVSRFVPSFARPSENEIRQFIRELGNADRLFVMTGAGISTESGIPDYRSAVVGQYARTNHRPVTHQEFLSSEHTRQRFWARNFLAWPRFRDAQPNETHRSIAKWERSDRFHWLVTQNVDGLHTKAGSSQQTELHGCGHRVKCMECDYTMSRDELQSMLSSLNPLWTGMESPGELNPDGDVTIEDGAEKTFKLADCPSCDGILKTDVVFFGDNVPRSDVDLCYEKVEESDGVLVLGSSLSVMSGYRFVHHASLRNLPIFIVNIGPTRADHLSTHRIHCTASMIVPRI
ncbi:hypothetical protein PENTCL1PPCAC_26853 [Pristionchus entomophagus]|uniref:NAD-dependent protein deacylase n=1 Tax=Pristionchus entomophagus TaxID=358040 RepID=A0AAV5UE67_9BILA|nr:hypothetical protein PENTCL1PPCAC_26853 [Pristionchus entomophagus]